MAALTQEGALLADTFGTQLLAYLCAADEEAITHRLEGQVAFGQTQEQVLAQLLTLATQLAATAAEDNVPIALRLDVLGRFVESAGTSIANALRLQAGGQIDLAIPDDPVAGPLALLLRDAFPLMLIPGERTFSHLHLTGAVWTSPYRKAFEEAVLADADLSRLFVEESEGGDWRSMVYRSTGSGGGLQLGLLADLLLTNAWWLGRLNGDCGRDALAGTLVSLLDLLRRATRGEPCEVKALVAFTGIVLDGVDEMQLPFGVLRSVRDHERELAPPSLEGHISHKYGAGDGVTASYAGDVVLEATVEYRLKVEPQNFDTFTAWPSDLRSFERLEANLDSIRLASLLAGDAEAMLTLVPTWRMVFDPLSWGPLRSWSDPRTGPSIAPRGMTATAAEELAAWTQAVHTHRRSSFDIAIRRTISASASRVDQLDALVDLVIAWENLFGSGQGESTLRVSAALGWLLGSTAEQREEIQAKAAKVYALRSAVVHANRVVTPEEAVKALSVAQRLTLAALRVLFRERTDLLALGKSGDRSRVLLMGG
jgi:Apea-like HEPN